MGMAISIPRFTMAAVDVRVTIELTDVFAA
jgi:hypothetical protein